MDSLEALEHAGPWLEGVGPFMGAVDVVRERNHVVEFVVFLLVGIIFLCVVEFWVDVN